MDVRALIVAFAMTIFGLLIVSAYAGEQTLCQLEPKSNDWHYRTKIAPLSDEKCWYDGPRMKPRDELYWAEVPMKVLPKPGAFEDAWNAVIKHFPSK